VLAFVVLAFNLLYLYAANLKHWDWKMADVRNGCTRGIAVFLASVVLRCAGVRKNPR
jgi:hypothetical protein